MVVTNSIFDADSVLVQKLTGLDATAYGYFPCFGPARAGSARAPVHSAVGNTRRLAPLGFIGQRSRRRAEGANQKGGGNRMGRVESCMGLQCHRTRQYG